MPAPAQISNTAPAADPGRPWPRPVGLVGLIERRPAAAFGWFLALHFAVWVALPALLYPNLPLDLIEALTYGREWQLGYDKLPPLPWWLVEVMHRAVGVDAAYYALGELSVVIAFAFVFATGRRLLGAAGALAGVLIVDGLHYFNFTAVKFNHDVVQLPFWAMAGFAFYAALKDGRLWQWALLGVALGCALWAKYFVVVLAAPYALLLLFDKTARQRLATPGPWLSAAIALAIASPHVVWLVQNDFLPFAYASHRAAPVRGWFDHVRHPATFAGSQLFFMLPALFIAGALFIPRALPGETGTPATFDRRIATVLALGPGLAMIALTAVSGRGTFAMWGYPLWLFVGMWLVMTAGFVKATPLSDWRLGRIVLSWATVFTALVVVFVASYAVMPRFDHRYRAVFFPGDALGRDLTERFHEATGKPLRYVVGTMWDGGNLAHYSADQPQVLIDGLPQRAPWIDLDDLKRQGAIVVWTESDPKVLPPAFAPVAANAEIGAPFDLPMRRGSGAVHVGWAILKPR